MSNQKPMSTEQARQIGATGGSVNTNGMPWQEKERINAAVNQGKQNG